MLRQSAYTLTLMFLLPAALVGDDSAKREWEKLNGAWQLVSYVYDGKEAAAKDIADYRMELDAGKLTAWLGNYSLKTASKTVDPTTQPKTMLETLTHKQKIKSIYHIDGDTLTICSAAAGADQPQEFASAKGSKHALWKFERIDPLQASLIIPGPKPLVYRSEKSGITLYVERDAQHVTAIDKDGQVLWHKHLTKGWKWDFYPNTYVARISYVGKPTDDQVRGADATFGQPAGTEYAYLTVGRGFGLLTLRTGKFFMLGSD